MSLCSLDWMAVMSEQSSILDCLNQVMQSRLSLVPSRALKKIGEAGNEARVDYTRYIADNNFTGLILYM